MELWAKTSLLLCSFGFLKEFRPSEPFITSFLLGPWKNFTEEQVNQEIYAVGTYSYLAVLIVIFLVTDGLRYKPVIILTGLTGIATWSVLTWGKTIPLMQLVEVLYGVFMASEVAYYTYIYAKVDRVHYQKVTSHTRSAYLTGRFTSSVVSQILVSTGTMNYFELNHLTVGAMVIATVIAFCLPTVPRSIYFHPETNNNLNQHLKSVESQSISTADLPVSGDAPLHEIKKERFVDMLLRVYIHLWKDFKLAYTNIYVLKWSLWWCVATCGFLQVLTYIQLLWDSILNENKKEEQQLLYNAAVEAIYTIIGAISSLACGWLRFNWQLIGELFLTICSLLQGSALLISALTNSLWVSYALYIVFGILYHTVMTITNSEVAKHISEDSYGLVFGINTFFALILQSVLTAVVVGNGGLELNAKDQFLVYGGYFLVLGAFFSVATVCTLCRRNICSEKLWLSNDTMISGN
ncbi:thiamine transporter 1-like [Schistocerca nitens]|uniref:thiamine transporter 1-like n=1 Tax=Schistocerca nitens TaxID=7011 RepID=UPI002118DE2E|nr:thiamine transporter 1-like [Schistocerca nitens]XP_049803677.1 thiamine transporter 1-like [Schistocerca nitens]XP_049803678.1 thiamine transporter 1-like [Schistocerca nitens]XP_049803679.1 thiamine transporter 1-like [Schistocerca nitens]